MTTEQFLDPAIVEVAAKARYESGARRAGTGETWEMTQPLIREWETESMEAALDAAAPLLAAQALREAADEVEAMYFGGGNVGSACSWGAKQAGKRLRARADALAPNGRAEGECPETGLHRELCAHCDDALEAGRSPDLPLHRTEAGYPNCSTCDGGGCPDCTDPA